MARAQMNCRASQYVLLSELQNLYGLLGKISILPEEGEAT
jgi:hypothetical protein